MSATQKQIAEKLNVSRSLVARALGGHVEVAEATRQRIETTAREMGYDRGDNHAARSLVARRYGHNAKSSITAITFPTSRAASPRYLPFFVPFLEGVETEAAALGMEVCLCPLRGGEVPRLIRNRGADGVIALGYSREHVDAIRALNMPQVLFQSRRDALCSVRNDDRDGAYQATRHLLELGHRRIAFLGMMLEHDVEAADWRFAGYRDALLEAGIAPREEWIETSLPLPETTIDAPCFGCGSCAACIGWAALMARSGGLDKKGKPVFTALVCHNDPIAMGAIAQARSDGLEVPRDLSVTGFDDVSRQYHFEPALTSIDFPRYDMGRCAVRLLHNALHEAEPEAQDRHRVFPATLVVRQSTAPPQR